MTKQRVYLVIITLLSLIIAAGVYKFILQGATSQVDQRVVIHLKEEERDLVLNEMRQFLNSVQNIIQGLSNDDFTLIHDAARASGNSVQRDMPGSLVGKLPLEFKTLGFDTHSRFDQIALDAESFSDKDHSLKQLSELMLNCLACHETYQFQQP